MISRLISYRIKIDMEDSLTKLTNGVRSLVHDYHYYYYIEHYYFCSGAMIQI